MICVTAQHSGQDAAYQLLAVRLADGALSRLGVRDWDWIGQVAWVKDGSGLIVNAWDSGSAVVADQLWFVAWPNGETRRVTNDLLNYAGVSVAVEAALLTTTRTERVTSLWVGAPGNRAQDLPPQISFGDTYSELLGMDWTADGRIVYASQASGNVDIWSRRPDGTDQRQLTSAPRAETAPVVAPDGQTILYVSYRSGNPLAMSDPPVTPPLGVPHIWRMKADGSQQQQLTNGKGERSPSLSPDGQWLVYAAPEGRKPQLWKKNLAGGEAVRLSELPGLQPQLSPDGRWVVCFLLNPEAGRMQFALIPFTANEPIRYLAQLPLPVWNTVRWTADSQALTFIQEANGVANLWRQSLSGGAPQQLTAFQNERIFRFAWSHDGQQLACERGVLLNDLVLINYRP